MKSLTVPPGLSAEIVAQISEIKGEPAWMRKLRLQSYHYFRQRQVPTWGPDLTALNFEEMTYFVRSAEKLWNNWDDVPPKLRGYFDSIGIPEAERKYLAGVEVQYDSEALYSSARQELADQGVLFCDTDSALRDHEDLIKQYFGTIIPYHDNTFAALNTAVWSGGSFIYVPKGVHVSMPINAFFRMNEPRFGQFERTLIVAEEGAVVEYIEGCTAPSYNDKTSLHAAVVEIIVHKGASVKYTTVQNWSTDVYNLVTKRADVAEKGKMQWVDANIGSCVTMKYPSVILRGDYSFGSIYSVALAGQGQVLDTGTKMTHLGKHTSSIVVSKAISKGNGHNEYRGMIDIHASADHAKSSVVCDAMLLDTESSSGTYPVNKQRNDTSRIEHEASVSDIDAGKLYYLQTRGLDELQAKTMAVSGFVEEIVEQLPLEFAVEFNKLVETELTNVVG